ncbi:MAG: twin-arginine translocation signal domain-containing protein [Actinomycetota bacterium]|nr:twin-arginine translocation signal domain-containing protein [Actinomycetota bacterium]
MGKRHREEGESGLSRRDFLKTGAAVAGAGAAGFEFAVAPSMAVAAEVDETYHTTCPYCSVSCGQLVDVDASGTVLDVYGDHMSPFNSGGLCAKGAAGYQLVTNSRRIGSQAGSHPVNPAFAYDGNYTDGVAYKRTCDASGVDSGWGKMGLTDALGEIGTSMVTARGAVNAANGYNSKSVAFFGSSHMNNEQNYAYRRLIAQFGTSNVEHQARI